MALFIFLQETYAPWLIPYAYAIVLLGLLIFIYRVFENWYSNRYDKPLFRHLGRYKRLSPTTEKQLQRESPFYRRLSGKNKKVFRHRVSRFTADKEFLGRDGLTVLPEMKAAIAASACTLSFGRKNYKYNLVRHILIFPKEFYSKGNETYHKGEFNPRERALVFSWEDFQKGKENGVDNRNLGIHEFMHAMQVEARVGKDLDSARFQKYFQKILKLLASTEIKEKLENTQYFRNYAFVNEFEFMAVLAEYFLESPEDFKLHFPQLYHFVKKMLNFEYAGY